MIRRTLHIAKAYCDGSENDRLILELNPKLSENQKRIFRERIRGENSEEVMCVCWRSDKVVRITLRRKNSSYARMDLPRIADRLIQVLFTETRQPALVSA